MLWKLWKLLMKSYDVLEETNAARYQKITLLERIGKIYEAMKASE
jgi:hypothetical protein